MARGFRFSIDRGGTFTDIYAELPNGSVVTTKLLSVDLANYKDAPTEGIRRILEAHSAQPALYSRAQPVVSSIEIESIRMGTTVATNALLERQGARCVLLITKGFGDLLQIGNQARPRIFDLEIARPQLLYENAIEIDERVRIGIIAIFDNVLSVFMLTRI
jgi:5-oxoprolinase (ATP-hydrolysing)